MSKTEEHLEEKTGAADSNPSGDNGGDPDQQGTGQGQGEGNGEGGTNTPEDKTGTGEGKPSGDPDTFPRSYVEELRTESAAHRTRAAGMAEELHALRVASLGILQDPTDLPPGEGLDTMDAVRAAVDDLVTRKPHLKVRRITGDIGQHEQQGDPPSAGLLGRMKKNA